MSETTVTVVDCSTGQVAERTLTTAEKSQRAKDAKEAAARDKADREAVPPLSGDEITQIRALLNSR